MNGAQPASLFANLLKMAFSSHHASLLPYPASRGSSIFLDKSGRGRDLCEPPRLSLISRSSTETDESVRLETSFPCFGSVRMCVIKNCWLNTRPQFIVYVREFHKMAAVSLPKDVFDKAVKSALGKVNTRGISALTQHQSKALLNFLCGKDTNLTRRSWWFSTLNVHRSPTSDMPHNKHTKSFLAPFSEAFLENQKYQTIPWWNRLDL